MKKISKNLIFAFLLFWTSLLFMTGTAAYIDPSVMTYAVQAVAGVVIASASLFCVLEKRKAQNQNKLGIDENAGKEVEEDIIGD